MRSSKILKLGVVWVIFILIACRVYAVEQIERNKILADNKEWETVYRGFEIDNELIEAMSYKMSGNLKIDVYFGFWCSDSKNNVPPFLKIIDRLEGYNANVPVNYYTVERKPTKETKYYVEEFKVERVPTFIFYKDGKEIGRIIENPKKSMIEDVMDIIM